MKENTVGLTMAVAALVGLGLVACRSAEEPQPPESATAEAAGEKTITGGEPFHGLLPYRKRDAKLALANPTFVTVDEAELTSGVSVVGVSLSGVHRAYPLYVLKNHQIVNDRLGAVPVAASW